MLCLPDYKTARLTLRDHGPLTDGELARWLARFKVPAGLTMGMRRRLAGRGAVQFAGKLRRTGPSRFAMLWKVTEGKTRGHGDGEKRSGGERPS